MRKKLLLLHGAIGASGQLQNLANRLTEHDVFLMDFPGHGKKEIPSEPFSIALFAEAVVEFLKQEKVDSVNIFGYSMGGYVAVYLAENYPQYVEKICTLATKFYWDKEVATKEIKMLDAEKILEKIPSFAATLQQRHREDWKTVLKKTGEMLASLGNENIVTPSFCEKIIQPVQLLLGDRDKMVSLEETVTIYKSLSAAQLAVLPNTPHPIEQVDEEALAYFIDRFLKA